MKPTAIIAAIAAALFICLASCGSSCIKEFEQDQVVKGFDSETVVPKSDIEYLLKAAMTAPVARNVAVWNFYAVEQNSMNKIAQAIGNCKGATAAIVICGNEARFMGSQGRGFWAQDCAAATENIMLAAKSKNLNAEWVRIYPLAVRTDAVKHALSLKPGQIPFAIVLLGKAKETQQMPSRYDKNLITWL